MTVTPEEPRRTTRALEYPVAMESLPDGVIEAGRYRLRFARSSEDLDQILRLRFNIFNLELGEGLDLAYVTQRDEDDFDARFHHLMIESRGSGEVVGTYRMQTAAMARANGGFYSADEFDLSGIPADVLERSVELGRACVAREHRNGRVLNLLWRGLACYLVHNRLTCLFGCCSLTSQEPRLGREVMKRLQLDNLVDDRVRVLPLPHTTCEGDDDSGAAPDPHIPALFQSYLNLGAKAWGPPAIDRAFKTIDFIVGLDITTVDPIVLKAFFR